MKPNRPEFHLERVLEDGTREEAQVVPVTSMPWDTAMDRRGALGVGIGAAGLLALLQRSAEAAAQAKRPTAPAVPPTQAPSPAILAHASRVAALAILADKNLVASCSEDNTIKLWSQTDAHLVATLAGHTDDVTALVASADGNLLASASKDGTIKVWSVSEAKRIATLAGHEQLVRALAFSADARVLWSGSEDRTIRFWSIPSGRLLGTLEGHSGAVRALAVTSDGRTLVSGSDDTSIRLWSIPSGKLAATLEGRAGGITALALGGQKLATGSANGVIKIWSLEENRLLSTLSAQRTGVIVLAMDGDGSTVASASGDLSIGLWSVADGTLKVELKASNAVTALAMTANRVVSGDRAGAMVLWDRSPERFNSYFPDPALAAMQQAKQIKAHTGAVAALMIAADGKTLVSGSADKLVKVWALPGGNLQARLTGHDSGVTSLAMPADGRTIVSGSYDKRIHVWSLADAPPVPAPAVKPAASRGKTPPPAKAPAIRTGKIERKLEGHTDFVTSLLLLNDGKTLLSSSQDKSIRTWMLPEGTSSGSLQGHTAAVRFLASSPDGQTLSSFGEDGIRLWSLSDARMIASLSDAVNRWFRGSFAASADGQILAVANSDGTLRLWSVFDGRALATLPYSGNQVTALTFTPDGGRLLSGTNDGAVCVWSVTERKLLAKLEGSVRDSLHAVAALAISPDGKLLASGHADGAVAFWSLENGQLLASYKAHGFSSVLTMAMSADGKWLATGDNTGAILLWDLEQRKLHTYLFDPAANDAGTKGLSYNVYDKITGQTITYTLPCGSPIPPGAICTCNCVPGALVIPQPPVSRPPVRTGGGRMYCSCDKICTCVPISSARWKQNIRPLRDALDRVTRLRGVQFDWTANAPQGRSGEDLGMLAEEVATVVPEVVAYDDTGAPSGVDYARLTAVLVEAVKTQQTQIEALQREIESLREQIMPPPGR